MEGQKHNSWNRRRNDLRRILGLLILTTLLSCQKEQLLRPDTVATGREPQLSVNANPQNDLDYIGHHHTYALDHLAGKSHFPNSTSEEIYNAITEYVNDSLAGSATHSYSTVLGNYESFIADTADNKLSFSDLDVAYFFDYLQNHSTFSALTHRYFDSILYQYENFTQTPAFINNIQDLEAKIISDTTLSDIEQEMLKGSCSIARNDLSYWDEVRNDAGHPWHDTYVAGLSSQQQKTLMLNLSAASLVEFSMVHEDAWEAGENQDNRIRISFQQASFDPGIVPIDPVIG